MAYATNTNVSVEKSKREIERTLERYGADQFAYGWDSSGKAMIGFLFNGRQIRFMLQLPDREDNEFLYTPSGKYTRTVDQQYAAWEQACRSRWRALALVIKAKLEAVDSGIVSFEDEFLAHMVLPDNTTVGDWIGEKLDAAYKHGLMPSMIPALELNE